MTAPIPQLRVASDGMLEPIWIDVLMRWLGIPETVKGKLNPVIVDMFAATRFPASQLTPKTSWCAAALCKALELSGVDNPRTARALDFLDYGDICAPRSGAIVVFEFRLNHGTGPTDHHVSVMLGSDRDQLLCLGGNQQNTVRKSWYPASAALGFRYPKIPDELAH